MKQYDNAKEDVEKFLDLQAKHAESYKKRHEGNGLKFINLKDIVFERKPEEIAVEKFLNSLSDNHLLVIHNLYYIGSSCLRRIIVWKKAPDRILQFKRSAGLISRNEVNKFNKPMNRGELIWTIMSKIPENVYSAVKGCVEICA